MKLTELQRTDAANGSKEAPFSPSSSARGVVVGGRRRQRRTIFDFRPSSGNPNRDGIGMSSHRGTSSSSLSFSSTLCEVISEKTDEEEDATAATATDCDDRLVEAALDDDVPRRQRGGGAVDGFGSGDDGDLGVLLRSWVRDAHAVLRSEEFVNLVRSTHSFVRVVAGSAVHVALLPVTAPAQAVASATSAVGRTASGLAAGIVGVGGGAGGQSPSEEQRISISTVVGGVVPLTIRTIRMLKDEVGGAVVNLVSPALNLIGMDVAEARNQRSQERTAPSSYCAGQSSAEDSFSSSGREEGYSTALSEGWKADDDDEDAAEDLSDYYYGSFAPSEDDGTDNTAWDEFEACSAIKKTSSFLRVCDLGLYADGDAGAESGNIESGSLLLTPLSPSDLTASLRVNYLELRHGTGPMHEALTVQALDALAKRGLALATDDGCSDCLEIFGDMPKWKPEGSTHRLLRRLGECQLDSPAWLELLERNVLVWSGRFEPREACGKNRGEYLYGRNLPMFKARAVVNMPPRDFTLLLLESDRVGEYNKYNLERTDECVFQRGVDVEDDLFGDGETKIVHSETRVPFTTLTVSLSTLMHARRIKEGENGYLIVSRSVSRSKGAGEEGQNEIVWGVNLLKGVSGHPSKTDLCSISQVSSSLVPNFLQHRIGIMGVVDFIDSMRSLCK